MKISQLIAMLRTIEDENGDLETRIGSAEVLLPKDYDIKYPELLLIESRDLDGTKFDRTVGPRSYYYAEDGMED